MRVTPAMRNTVTARPVRPADPRVHGLFSGRSFLRPSTGSFQPRLPSLKMRGDEYFIPSTNHRIIENILFQIVINVSDKVKSAFGVFWGKKKETCNNMQVLKDIYFKKGVEFYYRTGILKNYNNHITVPLQNIKRFI